MCGRFSRTSSREVLAEEFGVARFINVDLAPRYNIAPSQTVEAIIRDGAEKRLGYRVMLLPDLPARSLRTAVEGVVDGQQHLVDGDRTRS